MKVLLCSEFTYLNTGYSNYYLEIAEALVKAGHKVFELASYGDQNEIDHLRYAANAPWDVYLNIPNKKDKRLNEQYDARERVKKDAKFGAWMYDVVCMREKPDTVIGIRDFWYDKFIIESPLAKYVNVILSPTVDSMPQRGEWIDGFSRADAITCYNGWSEQWLRNQTNLKNIVPHIPPAANKAYVIKDRAKCRQEMGVPQDAVIFGTVMRNQKRKKYPELFEAFATYLYMHNKNNTYLYCHTAFPDRGWDIPELLLRYNIQNRVLFSYVCNNCGNLESRIWSDVGPRCPKCKHKMETCSPRVGASHDQMATIYGCFDMYFQPHNSEGFGIPVIEAAACGIPVCTVPYSAQEDIINKIYAKPIEYSRLECEFESNCLRALVDVQSIYDRMVEFEPVDKQVVRNVYDQNYGWDKTRAKWVELVESLPPKNLWNAPPDIKNPAPFEKIKHLSNSDFIDACARYVACDESRIGTYQAAEYLNLLNIGYQVHTDKATGHKESKITRITKEHIYHAYRLIRENINVCEEKRIQPAEQK